METRVTAIEQRLAEVEQRLEAAERRLAVTGQRLGRSRLFGRAAVLVGVAATLGLMSVGNSHAVPPEPVTTLNSLNTRLTAVEVLLAEVDLFLTSVEAKTAPLSVAGDDFIISGKNVHILDGSGFTFSESGLGNLTIGYNAPGNFSGDVRTGTHNLILGDRNNYSSFGGLVAGEFNGISGPYATVTGGRFNAASGFTSSVSGGTENVASGDQSSVSGGFSNAASGDVSSVSGGLGNDASGVASSVSGGLGNDASGFGSSVSGGNSRTAAGEFDWRAGSLLEDF